MFDTYDADYYLDTDNNIVWLQSKKIWDRIIWIQTWKQIEGYIWNPWVFAINKSEDNEIDSILEELRQTYSERIEIWLDIEWKETA